MAFGKEDHANTTLIRLSSTVGQDSAHGISAQSPRFADFQTSSMIASHVELTPQIGLWHGNEATCSRKCKSSHTELSMSMN